MLRNANLATSSDFYSKSANQAPPYSVYKTVIEFYYNIWVESRGLVYVNQ